MSKRSRPSGGGRSKKLRFDVVQDGSNPGSSAATTSSTVRHFSLHRRSNGRLGGQRTDTDVCMPDAEDPTFEPDQVSQQDVDNTNYEDIPTFEHHLDDHTSAPLPRRQRQKTKTNAEKIREWLPHREVYLQDLFLQDSPGHEQDSLCHVCGIEPGIIRCRDCFSQPLSCRGCAVTRHEDLPLHRIEAWTGQFFDKICLRDLGLRVQLGHGGSACKNPSPGPQDFTVIDSSGVHKVSVDFCDCARSIGCPRRQQLMHSGWFPATVESPHTVFTFDVLSLFHELTLQGKTTAYDFYHAIVRRTDNSGTRTPRKRLGEFAVVVRLWRHLTMLKRAGRAHDPSGAAGTQEGELAVECPACPHPGRNLPQGWENAPESKKWLYRLFLAIDANFRQKLKDRKIKDVELAPGWAYFVQESRYQKFLTNFHDEPEVNTCDSQHDAIVQASTRNVKGHIASGVGAVVCGRHGLVRRNGVGDLQKGERYVNMDYLIFATLMYSFIIALVLSYDICCQWSKKFFRRVLEFPPDMQPNLDPTDIEFVVPKWHLNAHGPSCQCRYCLNYLVGAGRTCGEIVETSWSHTNVIATSAREMGPGARHEVLNDHWGSWNWQKIIGFGSYLRKKYVEAVAMSKKHRGLFERFSATFSDVAVDKWRTMVVDWNMDRSKPNPYEEPPAGTTLNDVRLELAEEEASDAANGLLSAHEVTVSSFLNNGLDLEEQQRLICQQVTDLRGTRTAKENVDLQEKRNTLFRRIQVWRAVQSVYMPSVQAQLLGESGAVDVQEDDSGDVHDPDATHVEKICLWLPSSVPLLLRTTLHPDIIAKEKRLRIGQAEDSLAEIRRQRRMLTGLHQFKQRNLSGTGQKANTRMRALFHKFNQKTMRAASRYRASRQALTILDPDGEWQRRYLQLGDDDIRGPGRDEDEISEGRRVQSWIWLIVPAQTGDSNDVDDAELDETMRLEWAKSAARADCWEEEVEFLDEEMRHVLSFFEWKADWWRRRKSLRPDLPQDVQLGLAAYAEKQAAIMERLALKFAQQWLPAIKHNGCSPDWEGKYSTPAASQAEEAESNNSGVPREEGSNPESVPVSDVNPGMGQSKDYYSNEDDVEGDEEVNEEVYTTMQGEGDFEDDDYILDYDD